MIFLGRAGAQASGLDLTRVAGSLGIFAGHPAATCSLDGDLFAALDHPRARPQRGWNVPRGPGGTAVLLAGWIDNYREIASELGLPRAPEAELYGAAVERWGDDADRRLSGNYTAIAVLPDGTVRLARSPWARRVGSSRVDLQACKLEYSIVSPK